MDKSIRSIGLSLLIMLLATSSVFADALFKPHMVRQIPSTLMPVIEGLTIDDSLNAPISADIGNKIYDRCMSKVPQKFTPNAHNYYCTCSAAATVGNLTRSELKTMQNRKNWVAGNKTFEKYVSDVISPCMDVPVDEIEYLSCALNTRNDARINDIPNYCKCVKAGIGLHFRDHGIEDIILGWKNGANRGAEDPVTTLWDSYAFQNERSRAREACVWSNMRIDPFKGR